MNNTLVQWEYMNITPTAEGEKLALAELGELGWEMCGLWPGTGPYAIATFYFKRPLQPKDNG